MTVIASRIVAAASYPVEALPDWEALAAKLDAWIVRAACGGAHLLVLPEYGGMEAALVGPRPRSGTAAEWCRRSADAAPRYAALCGDLARRHRVWMLSGSLPTEARGRIVNRAHLHDPDGTTFWQDKQILTPWERENTPIAPGDDLWARDTPFGRLGILICYDSEFPPLAHALAADLLLVPACTDDEAGQSRVQVAARARALEGQGIAVHAPLLGGVAECPLVDANTGCAGIFAPPDRGFPPDGILALGRPDTPGWIFAPVDPAAIASVRSTGAVRPLAHWPEAERRGRTVTIRRDRAHRP